MCNRLIILLLVFLSSSLSAFGEIYHFSKRRQETVVVDEEQNILLFKVSFIAVSSFDEFTNLQVNQRKSENLVHKAILKKYSVDACEVAELSIVNHHKSGKVFEANYRIPKSGLKLIKTSNSPIASNAIVVKQINKPIDEKKSESSLDNEQKIHFEKQSQIAGTLKVKSIADNEQLLQRVNKPNWKGKVVLTFFFGDHFNEEISIEINPKNNNIIFSDLIERCKTLIVPTSIMVSKSYKFRIGWYCPDLESEGTVEYTDRLHYIKVADFLEYAEKYIENQ